MNVKINEKKIVVGFWMRLLSDSLDAIFLAAFGFLLSIPFGGLFYQMGEKGLWLGLIISFLYTGILQSSIGQGQSLAKKFLKIQVLRLDGSFLSLPQSFLRYLIISLIYYNQWIGMGLLSLFPALNISIFQTLYSVVILFLLISTVILVAFHPLKRGLHDMLVGSIVVYKKFYCSFEFQASEFKEGEAEQLVQAIEGTTKFRMPSGMDAIKWLNELMISSDFGKELIEMNKAGKLLNDASNIYKRTRSGGEQLSPEEIRFILEENYPQVTPKRKTYDPDKISELMNPSKEKKAFIFCGILFFLSLGGLYFISQSTKPLQPLLAELMTEKQEIENNTQFTNVAPNFTWQNSKQADGSTKKTEGVNMRVFLEKSEFDDEENRTAEVQKVVDIVVKSFSKLSECNYINVQVRTGYNIGIWSFYITQNYLFKTDGTPYKKDSE